MIKLERVKPTEPAILEMVRNHYSHRDNMEKRPRTEKTGKTWWSNARLVVFSDPERTLVFAWQWPKPGMRADGQEGFNNTLFHRPDRCTYLASDIVLAAEQAVIEHWGSNRAYTYVDPGKIKSSNPGYCYKMAGWIQVKISKSGKPLLEKFLTNGNDNNHQEKRMSIKQIVRYLELKSQLSPEDLAFAERIVSWTEAEKETLAGLLQPVKVRVKPATKRVIEKCAKEGCGFTRRHDVHKLTTDPDYHEFQSPQSSSKSKRAESLAGAIKKSANKEPRCVVCFETRDHAEHDVANGGHEFEASVAARANEVLDRYNKCDTCGRGVDENIHQLSTAQGYHEFAGSEPAVAAGG